MASKNGPWTVRQTTEEYRDDFIQVYRDDVVRPDGDPGTYSTVTMPSGVSILALGEDGSVHLTRQFRYAVGRDSLEVASGAIDGGEEPLEAARRELREELGIEAEEWTDLGRVDLDTSIVRSPAQLFLARRLSFTGSDQEGTEVMRPVKTSLAEAVQLVMDSEITHSPSCVLILKAARWLAESKNPPQEDADG